MRDVSCSIGLPTLHALVCGAWLHTLTSRQLACKAKNESRLALGCRHCQQHGCPNREHMHCQAMLTIARELACLWLTVGLTAKPSCLQCSAVCLQRVPAVLDSKDQNCSELSAICSYGPPSAMISTYNKAMIVLKLTAEVNKVHYTHIIM